MLVSLHKDGVTESREFTLVCHRGGKGFGPENTLQSLSGALEFGVEMVEIDVRTSMDGVPFIHHSPFLGLHLLSHMNMSEIRDKAPDIPTLEEYLSLTGGRCSINMEIKRCQPSLLAEMIDWASREVHVLVSSFDAEYLADFRKTGSAVELGLLAQYDPSLDRPVTEAINCGAKTLLPVYFSVRGKLVELAHEAGLRVMAWTVNDTSQLRNMIMTGVDGVITDCYREFKEFLESEILEPETGRIPLLDDGSLMP